MPLRLQMQKTLAFAGVLTSKGSRVTPVQSVHGDDLGGFVSVDRMAGEPLIRGAPYQRRFPLQLGSGPPDLALSCQRLHLMVVTSQYPPAEHLHLMVA
jgi:hypothetical protein